MLGNELQSDTEIKKQRNNTIKAFAGLIRIWSRRSDISIGLKMKLYNAIVKPHLTYNATASAYAGQQVSALEKLQRRQLRRVLNVYCPAHISYADVFEWKGAHPISIGIAKIRWSFFGHVLRQLLGSL